MAKSPITEQVKSYEDACKLQGIQPLTLDQFSFLPEDQRKPLHSLHRIVTVIAAVNEGHVFDWNDEDEEKHYPWWDMETYGDAPAGSGFSLLDSYCALSATYVSARLSLRSREDALYVGNLMLEDYRIWIKQIATEEA